MKLFDVRKSENVYVIKSSVQKKLARNIAGRPLGFYRISTTKKKNPNIDQISTTQHFIDQISTAKGS